ncbi:hypothetical protein ACFX15_028075 [Malus domestica]
MKLEVRCRGRVINMREMIMNNQEGTHLTCSVEKIALRKLEKLFGFEWWVFFVEVGHYVRIKTEVLIVMLRHAQAVKVHHRAPVRRKSSVAWGVTGIAGVRVGEVGMVAVRLRWNKVSGVANRDGGSADLNLEPRGGGN